MAIHSIEIPARDGYRLAATVYEASGRTSGEKVAVISSAAGMQRRFYDRYAQFLVDSGFVVVTYDYRGVGGSAPPDLRSFEATMHEWGSKDLAGVIDWAIATYPSAQLAVVGHSAGGQMVGLAENNARVGALLAIASQSGYWGLWDGPTRYRWAFLWYVTIPVLTRVFAYCPTKLLRFGENLPAGVGLEWARWCRNPAFIVNGYGQPIREHFASFSAPILAYSFSDDPYAPQRAVRELLSFYANAPREHRHVRPEDANATRIGHFGFFSPHLEASLWQDSLEWLLQH